MGDDVVVMIVDELLKDLASRPMFKTVWEQLRPEQQAQLELDWQGLVREELEEVGIC